MERIPLPSHIHYELLLQLLERQTLAAAERNPLLRDQVQQMIVTLRKALAQQRQLETICEQGNLPYEYRWSLHSLNFEPTPLSDLAATPHKMN